MKIILTFLLLISYVSVYAQSTYTDSLRSYRKNYTQKHEVVTGKEKKKFRFFKIDPACRVTAAFERIMDTTGFIMKTTGERPKKFYRYGKAHGLIGMDSIHVYIYQSDQLRNKPEYRDHLFVPFTDLTSGEESYGGGRYIDLMLTDIKDNLIVIDFNKSYNPYCSYKKGFNCPVPPRENDIPVAIRAGEKAFGKKH